MKKFFVLLLLIPLLLSAQTPGAPRTPRFKNVIWVVFENKNYSTSLAQPIFRAFADRGISFSQMVAETHPSQGNYIAMIGGDVMGVSGISGDNPVNLNASHLGDLLEKNRMDWRVYAENYPGNCFTGATSGLYARKHVPFISFTNVSSSPQRCGKIVEFSGFQSDWSNHRLANFNMVIPNLENDAHNTDMNFAGLWFDKTFSQSLNDPRLMQDTLFVVTFDESESYFGANQIYTALISPNLPQKITIKDKHDHYSLLKFLEDEWQLGNLGRKDLSAKVINELKAR